MSSLLSIKDYVNIMISRYSNKDYNAIDMTLGNGHDSLILSDNFKQVYSFDIQPEALANSRILLSEKNNVSMYLDSHDKFDSYDINDICLIIYNLGYLPGSDMSITTLSKTTLLSISKGLEVLNKKGIMIITLYPGHKQGEDEANEIENYLTNLNNKHYHISKYEIINANKAPYVICIHKK